MDHTSSNNTRSSYQLSYMASSRFNWRLYGGNITNKVGPPLKTSNSIQILNIVDYKWVKSFPGLSPNSKTSPTASALSPTTILAIVVSVGFALIIAASIGIFLLHRRNRQKKNARELSSIKDASSSAHSFA
nr:5462_t:CDS:2 [Entrophospora candida]